MSFLTRNKFGRTCSCSRTRRELSVQSGLSYTPAQMQSMAERGIPVSSQSMDGLFYDGDPKPTWDVPMEHIRGIDAAALWQKRKDVQSKMRNGYKKDVTDYGIVKPE